MYEKQRIRVPANLTATYTSPAVPCKSASQAGFYLKSTNSTSASVTAEASEDGTNWVAISSDGLSTITQYPDAYNATVANGRWICFFPTTGQIPWRYVRISVTRTDTINNFEVWAAVWYAGEYTAQYDRSAFMANVV